MCVRKRKDAAIAQDVVSDGTDQRVNILTVDAATGAVLSIVVSAALFKF